jgi:hypothetical protein
VYLANNLGLEVHAAPGPEDPGSFVADPLDSALAAVMGVQVKRGLDKPRGGRHLLPVAPAQLALHQDILLHPHLPEDFNGFQFAYNGWAAGL